MKIKIIVKSVSNEPFVIDLGAATWLSAVPTPAMIAAITMRRLIGLLSPIPCDSVTLNMARTPPNTMASITLRGDYDAMRSVMGRHNISPLRGSYDYNSNGSGDGAYTVLYSLESLDLYHATSLKRWIMTRKDFEDDVAYCYEGISQYTDDIMLRQIILSSMSQKLDTLIESNRKKTSLVETVALSIPFLDQSSDFLPSNVYGDIAPPVPYEIMRKLVVGKGLVTYDV